MRIIDADALDIFLENAELKARKKRKYVLKSALNTIRGIIRNFPSAKPEPQWIPCSKRLPEENGRYLVTRGLNACGSLWNRIYIENYSDLMGIKSERIWWQGNVGKIDFERLDDVLAWMPLPERWEGESNERA